MQNKEAKNVDGQTAVIKESNAATACYRWKTPHKILLKAIFIQAKNFQFLLKLHNFERVNQTPIG